MRPDLDLVAAMVGHGASVVDLGCGDGELLEHLITRQGCTGAGVERESEGFHACIARGVPVTQGDLEEELERIGDSAFDCAVLSLTLQATRRPDRVLEQMRRVAPRRVVSLPNFAHWQIRLDLAATGRMPANRSLPYTWYETPNIHLCTLRDFEGLVSDMGMRTVRRALVEDTGRPASRVAGLAPNLLAHGAVYLLEG